MKIVLILFASLIFIGSPLMAAQDAVEAADTESKADSNAYADSLFKGRCQMCHQLPEPDMLKPNQWRLILGTMQQRMQQAGVPALTEEETNRLLAYLTERAR